jgi:hypothetical protein
LLAHDQWFSPGTPASSTTKTGRHDIAEILLKMALNIKAQTQTLRIFIHVEMCENKMREYLFYTLTKEIH